MTVEFAQLIEEIYEEDFSRRSFEPMLRYFSFFLLLFFRFIREWNGPSFRSVGNFTWTEKQVYVIIIR